MKTPHNIKEVVKSHLCIGCGLCTIDKETQGIQLSHKNDCLVPKNVKVSDTSLANIICPGKGYDIKVTVCKRGEIQSPTWLHQFIICISQFE